MAITLDTLPNEILDEILMHTNYFDTIKMQRVNRHFQKVSKALLRRKFKNKNADANGGDSVYPLHPAINYIVKNNVGKYGILYKVTSLDGTVFTVFLRLIKTRIYNECTIKVNTPKDKFFRLPFYQQGEALPFIIHQGEPIELLNVREFLRMFGRRGGHHFAATMRDKEYSHPVISYRSESRKATIRYYGFVIDVAAKVVLNYEEYRLIREEMGSKTMVITRFEVFRNKRKDKKEDKEMERKKEDKEIEKQQQGTEPKRMEEREE